MEAFQVDDIELRAAWAALEDAVLSADTGAEMFLRAAKRCTRRAKWAAWVGGALVLAMWAAAAATGKNFATVYPVFAVFTLAAVSGMMMLRESEECKATDWRDRARHQVAGRLQPGEEAQLPWKVAPLLSSGEQTTSGAPAWRIWWSPSVA